MKKIQSAYTVAISLITGLTFAIQLAAQQQPQEKALPRYRVVDLGPANDWAGGVNNKGAVDGTAILDRNQRAFLWRKGAKINLGTFGGPNSVAFKAPTEKGWVVGKAETSHPDPFGEDFCLFNTQLICLPFVWQNGVMIPLRTLGGNNGIAFSVNNRGQVAGSTENTTQDATCPVPAPALETKPVIWQQDTIKELPTLSNDPDGVVLSINDDSQAVGASFDCSGSVTHALLWHQGTVTDLGNLGGVTNNFAQNINNRGQVVGFSDLPGDATFHAFVWTEDQGIQDLGALPGDVFSGGDGNDEQDRVVGFSCTADFNICRGVFWQGGTITDLNTLIPADSPLFLVEAFSINSRGEISGFAIDQATDEGRAFLAVPEDNSETSWSLASGTAVRTGQRDKVLPEDVRKMFQQRAGLGGFSRAQQQVRLANAAVTSAPTATLSPTSLIFSTQAIGATSASETVALKNTGTTSLTISSIAITGTNAGDFAQTHTCASSLAAGASCSIRVTLRPTASGTRAAALSISDNAAGSPQKVALGGIGTTAKLSPISLSFGTVAVGTISAAKTVTLTNVGATTLTITGIAITGTNAGNFAQTYTCGSSLASSASCTIAVSFKPTQQGIRTGTLSITDNVGEQMVALSGIGTVSTTVTLSPTSLSFFCGWSPVLGWHWYCSPPQTVSLTNAGSATLYITNMTTTGSFSQTNNCGTSLGAKQSCSITVTEHASPFCRSGTYSGVLAINDTASGSPQTVALALTLGICF